MNNNKPFGRRALSAFVWLCAVFASLFLGKWAGTSENLVTLFITKATEVFIILSVSLTATDSMTVWKDKSLGGPQSAPPTTPPPPQG